MKYYDTTGNVVYITEYGYNNIGNIIRARSHNSSQDYTINYEYNNNNIIKSKIFDNNSNELLLTTTYKYNILNQCTEEVSENYSQNPIHYTKEKYKYEYDGSGNRIKMLAYNYNDSLLATLNYLFDDNVSPDHFFSISPFNIEDDQIQLVSIHNVLSITSADTTFPDQYGHLIVNTGTNYVLAFKLYFSAFTYNKDNYPIKEKRTYTSEPSMTDLFEFEYK